MIVCVTGIMFRLMTTWILSSKAASLVDRALELGGVVSGYQKDDLSTNLSCQAFSSQLEKNYNYQRFSFKFLRISYFPSTFCCH